MVAPVSCCAGRSADIQWAADSLRRSFRPGGPSATELHKHMDDRSVAQRQLSRLGSSSFAALTVLAVCFTLSMLGRGFGESFTVFLLPISETFGWNRGQIISIYSLASLASALASPLVGRMFDRFGPRAVYSLGLVVLGGAFLVGAYGQQLWQFQLSLGLCVGLGVASIGIVPNSILLGRWFGPRLPTAMAVVYSAGGAGVLMLLPVSQLLIDHVGWRGAYQVFAGAVLLLLVPLLLLPWQRFSAGAPALGKARAADRLDTAGPCLGPSATTHSGVCLQHSSLPRLECSQSRRRSWPISSTRGDESGQNQAQ